MLFRAAVGSAPVEMTLDELRALVRTGTVEPNALVRDPLLTRDEWWTIDNLRLFHNCSPIAHAPGEHLLQLVAQREASRATSRLFGEWFVEYRRGDVIERALGLMSLDEITAAPGVFGASRLFIMPSFRPETLCTFTFGRLGIAIDVARAERMVWHRHSGEPVGRTIRAGHVEPTRVPQLFETWERFVAAAESAGECHSDMCDGIGFRHRVRASGDPDDVVDVEWSNPFKKHESQWSLLDAYLECLQVAGLDGEVREHVRGL